MNIETKNVFLIGAGGHAGVVYDALLQLNITPIGYIAPARSEHKWAKNVKWLGDDEVIKNYQPSLVTLVNGIGSKPRNSIRKQAYTYFKQRGFQFLTIVHPSGIVAMTCDIGQGSQVMAGAVIQNNANLGENVVINTKASVDHDCNIADHVHIAPGATLCGNVMLEEGVYVGAGTTIKQGVRIAQDAVIAAGAVVISDVASNEVFSGVPAKKIL